MLLNQQAADFVEYLAFASAMSNQNQVTSDSNTQTLKQPQTGLKM